MKNIFIINLFNSLKRLISRKFLKIITRFFIKKVQEEVKKKEIESADSEKEDL